MARIGDKDAMATEKGGEGGQKKVQIPCVYSSVDRVLSAI
jgi:hypothetical protein